MPTALHLAVLSGFLQESQEGLIERLTATWFKELEVRVEKGECCALVGRNKGFLGTGWLGHGDLGPVFAGSLPCTHGELLLPPAWGQLLGLGQCSGLGIWAGHRDRT